MTETTANFDGQRTHTARTDRRQNNKLFSRHRLNGRRHQARRSSDAYGAHHVDRYNPRIVIASLLILVLCIADAFMTLNLINHGATEVNLVMRIAIEEGVAAFIFTKYLMTAISVLFLVIHSHFRIARWWQVHHVIAGFALVYIALLIYEVALLQGIS